MLGGGNGHTRLFFGRGRGETEAGRMSAVFGEGGLGVVGRPS